MKSLNFYGIPGVCDDFTVNHMKAVSTVVCIDLHVSLRWYRVLDNPNRVCAIKPSSGGGAVISWVRVILKCFPGSPRLAGDPGKHARITRIQEMTAYQPKLCGGVTHCCLGVKGR